MSCYQEMTLAPWLSYQSQIVWPSCLGSANAKFPSPGGNRSLYPLCCFLSSCRVGRWVLCSSQNYWRDLLALTQCSWLLIYPRRHIRYSNDGFIPAWKVWDGTELRHKTKGRMLGETGGILPPHRFSLEYLVYIYLRHFLYAGVTHILKEHTS